MTALQPVKAESLSVQVADSIREAIFRGELKPGQVLRELGLARNLNVSQATVREALSQLEHYGLVVRTPNRSTSVTSLSMTEVRDRIRVRVALECLAFCDAAQRATPEQFSELELVASRIKEKVNSKDSFEIMKADRRFHQMVWETTGNATLYRTLDQLTTPLFAFLRIYQELTASDHIVKPVDKLIEAMRSRDNDTITAAVKEHIEGSHRSFLDLKAPELSSLVEPEEQP
jgi:DNA-binding GntR family transcriptional regulator